MFCYQCEQTAKGTGCNQFGVCGKSPEVSDLQDMLVYGTLQLGKAAHAYAETGGAVDESVDLLIFEGLFTTVTNVDFDPERIQGILKRVFTERDRMAGLYEKAAREKGISPKPMADAIVPRVFETEAEWLEAARKFSPAVDIEKLGEDLAGVKWLCIYGLKGTAAYADHAWILGQKDDAVRAFFRKALAQLAEPIDLNAALALALEVGTVNLRVMELLDAGNTGTYGHPEPTSVRVTPVKGKAILVSGHDLVDLEHLLQQTAGKGINVYTHGEMLPCNAYPKLKKYPHLVGNYGGAWQDQQKEFADFPGAILMTTNCIQNPRSTYRDRIFTSGLVAWPGVRHVEKGDFSPVIEAALAASGFAADEPEKRITIGFAHNAVMAAAGKVIDLVKQGKIRHFFLIGGCDGAKPGRNYYTQLAEDAPRDTVILTLACGKYRFNKLDFGDIEGIPRLLDCGQCNDSYSAIQIAVALAKAFGTDVNSLPLSLILSWYEQKAVCVLLTLLSLGIKDIRVGPSVPAFLTPAAVGILNEKFGLRPIGTPEEDLKAILG